MRRLFTFVVIAALATMVPIASVGAGEEPGFDFDTEIDWGADVPQQDPGQLNANSPDTYRITARVSSFLIDDNDCIIFCVFRPPGSLDEGEAVTIVQPNLLNRGGPIHDPAALRRAWWRGPFIDQAGLGLLGNDDDAWLCFRDQAAWWSAEPNEVFRVSTHVGFFMGNPACDSADLWAEKEMSVAAAADGPEQCTRWQFEKKGDRADVLLCLRVEHINPRPIAYPTTGNSGTAPFDAVWDGSLSEVDGYVQHWRWDMGDGTVYNIGSVAGHRYSTPGSYPVTLTITDSNGLTARSVVGVVTVHAPTTGPIAVVTGPATADDGDMVVFDASASSPGTGTRAAIFEYRWDFGDGSQATTRDPLVTHVYGQEGTFTVTLEVFNTLGETSWGTTTIHIS